MDDLTCKNHKCKEGPRGSRATFTPTRRGQEFCSAKCRTERAVWRATRGSVLIDPLLDGDWKTLREIRAELMKEVDA